MVSVEKKIFDLKLSERYVLFKVTWMNIFIAYNKIIGITTYVDICLVCIYFNRSDRHLLSPPQFQHN